MSKKIGVTLLVVFLIVLNVFLGYYIFGIYTEHKERTASKHETDNTSTITPGYGETPEITDIIDEKIAGDDSVKSDSNLSDEPGYAEENEFYEVSNRELGLFDTDRDWIGVNPTDKSVFKFSTYSNRKCEIWNFNPKEAPISCEFTYDLYERLFSLKINQSQDAINVTYRLVVDAQYNP